MAAIIVVVLASAGTALAGAAGPEPVAASPEAGSWTNESQPVVALEFDEDIQLADGADPVTLTHTTTNQQQPGVQSAVDSENSRVLNVTYAGSLVDGEYTVTVPAGHVQRSSDLPGNAAHSWSFTVDTVAHPPVITGVDQPVNLANQSSVDVEGRAEANSTVTVTFHSDGVNVTASSSANSMGVWIVSADLSGLPDGVVTVDATSVDQADNQSGDSLPQATRKDTVRPSEEETSSGGAGSFPPVWVRYTEPIRPNEESASQVPVLVSDTTLERMLGDGNREHVQHSAVPDLDTVHLVPRQGLVPGTYEASVPASSVWDLAGNEPAADVTWQFTVTAATRPAPTMFAPTAATTARRPEIAATFDREVVLQSPTPAVTLTAGDADNNPDGVSATVQGSNRLVVSYTGELKSDLYTVAVPAGVVRDAQDESSTNEAFSWSFAVGSIAPAVTVDPQTKPVSASLTVSGSVEPDAQVTVTVGDLAASMEKSVTETSDGRYRVTFTDADGWTTLADGTLPVQATATKPGRPDGKASGTAVKDTRKPAPVAAGAYAPADASTMDSRTPEVSVRFDENVSLPAGGEQPLLERQSPDGSWTKVDSQPVVSASEPDKLRITYGEPLADGNYRVTVPADVVRDAAGNPNDPLGWNFRVDSAEVNRPPVITSFPLVVNADNQESVTVGGDAQPGASVRLTVSDAASETDDVQAGPVVVPSDGRWVFDALNLSELADEVLLITVQAAAISDPDDDGQVEWVPVTAVARKDAQPPVAQGSPTEPASGPRPTVRATFDEAVRTAHSNPTHVAGTTLTRASAAGPQAVRHTAVIDLFSVHLVVDEDLVPGSYTATIPAESLTDLAGNRPAGDIVWSFNVTAATAPTATTFHPAGISKWHDPIIAVTFDREVTLVDGAAAVEITAGSEANRPQGVIPIIDPSNRRRLRVTYSGTLANDIYRVVVPPGFVADAGDPTRENAETVWTFGVRANAPAVTVDPQALPVSAGWTVSGSVEPGATVTVTLKDQASAQLTGVAAGTDAGRYAVTFSAANGWETLAEGRLAATVRATASRRPTAEANGEAVKDSVAPAAEPGTIKPAALAINTSNPEVSLRLSESVAARAPFANASLTVAGGTAPTVSAALIADNGSPGPLVRFRYRNDKGEEKLADGVYTATIPAGSFADAAGNPSPLIHWTFQIDTELPDIQLDALDDVTADNEDSYRVTGTTEADAALTVTISGQPGEASAIGTGTADSTGQFDIAMPTLEHFKDGELSIQVEARDAAGNDDQATGTVLKRVYKPHAPTSVAAQPHDQAVTLTWQAPAPNDGTPVSAYLVTATLQSDPDSGAVATEEVDAETLEATLDGLENGMAYTLAVTARNAAGDSLPGTVAATPFGAPGTPEVSLTRDDGSVTLAWEPVSGNGRAVSGYELTITADGSDDTDLRRVGPGHDADDLVRTTITDLSKGSDYEFQVRAETEPDVWSAFSEPISARFAGRPAPPTELEALGANGEITLTWTAPSDNGGEPITEFVVVASAPGEDDREAAVSAEQTSHEFSGLTNGVTYSLTVAAKNLIGPSDLSDAVQAVPGDVPAAPSGLKAQRGDGQVALIWNALTEEEQNGFPVTDYMVTVTSPSGDETEHEVGGPVEELLVTGLSNGTTYSFRVRAVNDAGVSAFSEAVPAKPARAPQAPTGLAATAGNSKVTLSWTAPSDNGGEPISTYEVSVTPTTGVTGTTTRQTDSAGTTYEFTGLTNGTAYTFTVLAINDVGSSAQSVAASATPVAPTSSSGGGGGAPGPVISPSPSPTASPTPTPSPTAAPGPLPGPGPVRINGQDRASTAAAVSASHFDPGVPTVYIATSANFADALAGGPAAAISGGPILLVDRDGVPESTEFELQRLRPENVVVLGGTGAISDGVLEQLNSVAPATRVSGSDRFATAAAVSRHTFPERASVVYIATGSGFADALSGGAAAARNRGPVLLVGQDGIPAATAEELRRLDARQIVVLGGSAAVPANVAAQLNEFTDGPVQRISGPDRYATSAAIAERMFPVAVDTVFVATGQNFPDALAGVPAAAREKAPLLLVRHDAVPDVVGAQLERLRPRRIVILGGSGAVSADTEQALSRYIGG